jgi:hypothetical protein
MSKKLYVASSWRNPYQPEVVRIARSMGFSVYDFRRPHGGETDTGFSWKAIDSGAPKDWSYERYREVLAHPVSEAAFQADLAGLQADATLLVMPAGRSAHWEHGYAVGRGQQMATLYPVGIPMPDTFGSHAPTSSVCMECHPEYAQHGGIPTLDRYVCELRHKLRRDFEPELMVKGGSGGILIGRKEMEQWLQSVLDMPPEDLEAGKRFDAEADRLLKRGL